MGYTLCVLGCGTLGTAVLSGVLDSLASPTAVSGGAASSLPSTAPPSPSNSQTLDPASDSTPSRFVACVGRPETARRLRRNLEVQLEKANIFLAGRQHLDLEVKAGENESAVADSDVIILGCKPQLARAILTSSPEMAAALDGKLLISLLAGTTISQLQGWVPETTRVIRAMPNTPCKIRQGMIVLSSQTPADTSFTRAILMGVFNPIGTCMFLPEKHFDAATALSGSGPAFACVVMEAFADGGVMMGLPRPEAVELAAQMMQGAARMVIQSGQHPAQIKDSVTTPGGCTIAGLLALEDGKVRSTMARCIQTATSHAAGLGQN